MAQYLDENMAHEPTNDEAGDGGGGGGGGGGGPGSVGGGLGAGVSIPGMSTRVFEPVAPCVSCGRHQMTLKTKKDNKGFYIGCEGFPDCKAAIWLPDYAVSVAVKSEEEPCSRCGWKKFDVKVKPGNLPPFMPSNMKSVCLGGCDPDLNSYLGIRIPSLSSGGSTSSSNNNNNKNNNKNKQTNKSSTQPSARNSNVANPRSASLTQGNSRSNAGNRPNPAPKRPPSSHDDDFSDFDFDDDTFDDPFDEPPRQPLQPRQQQQQRQQPEWNQSARTSSASSTSQNQAEMCCGCGKPPVEMITKKEGPNQVGGDCLSAGG